MQLPIKEINGSKTQQIITTKKGSKKINLYMAYRFRNTKLYYSKQSHN
jgi:hypothetical protein